MVIGAGHPAERQGFGLPLAALGCLAFYSRRSISALLLDRIEAYRQRIARTPCLLASPRERHFGP
jgi:hypothetical protein